MIKEIALKWSYGVAAIGTLLSMNATASSGDGPKSVGVGITDNRGTSIALNFTPPDEHDWNEERSGLSVTLKQTAASADDLREIEAYLMKPDAPVSPIAGYVENIRRNLEQGYASSKTFKIQELDVTADPKDSRCARVHLLLEAVEPTQATQERRWSEQYALSCGSLKHKRMGFELRYYHRYTDSHKDKHFAEEARRLLEGVIIEDQ